MRHKLIYSIIIVIAISSAILISKKQSTPVEMDSQVYEHYQNDSLKLKAAKFLIENMKWHDIQPTLSSYPEHIRDVINGADSVYRFITQGINDEILNLGATQGWLRHRAAKYSLWRDTTFKFPTKYSSAEFNSIDADFLIRHIDNAFERWESSPYAKGLDFSTFCEYILPFTALHGRGYNLNGAELYEQFSPDLDKTYPTTLPNIVSRYSNYIGHMRNFAETKQERQSNEWIDIFFSDDRDCIPQCDVECNVLRAMGVPTAIDMNIGNREFVGQHHHCIVLDEYGKEVAFHGERHVSKDDNWGYVTEYKLNVYRYLYGAQEDSPYMLRKKDEPIPPFFETPALKDVTSYIKPVGKLTLDIPRQLENNLTWLYSYARSYEAGIQAVTWGVNDTVNDIAIFNNVVRNMLYFPAYLDVNEDVNFIGEPLIVMSGLNHNQVYFEKLADYCIGNSDTVQDVIMTRKFPRKPNMIKDAKNMIGGVWYGSQNSDGLDRVKLAEVDFMPEAHMQEIKIKAPKAYRYYIYESPKGVASGLGELEFLTNSTFDYQNTKDATPLPILSSKKVKVQSSRRVQLLPLHMNGSEFDLNQQTANFREVFCYEFPEPQVVTSIAFAPVNAENSIEPGEDYQLFQWSNGWQEVASVVSEFNFLEFNQLDTRKLYWLRNNSRGQEEVPFIIADNRPQFIYYDCIKPQLPKSYNILSTANYSCIASSEEPEEGAYEPGYANFIIDSDTTNVWHSQYSGVCPPYPHWVEIGAQNITRVNGFVIKLRSTANKPKFIRVSGSVDKKVWQDLGMYELKHTDERQAVYFKEAVKLRYLKIDLLSGQNDEPHSCIMYIKLLQYK